MRLPSRLPAPGSGVQGGVGPPVPTLPSASGTHLRGPAGWEQTRSGPEAEVERLTAPRGASQLQGGCWERGEGPFGSSLPSEGPTTQQWAGPPSMREGSAVDRESAAVPPNQGHRKFGYGMGGWGPRPRRARCPRRGLSRLRQQPTDPEASLLPGWTPPVAEARPGPAHARGRAAGNVAALSPPLGGVG